MRSRPRGAPRVSSWGGWWWVSPARRHLHPFVPRVIRAFRDGAPDIALTLEEGGTIELIDDLRHERVDSRLYPNSRHRPHWTDRQSATGGGDAAGVARHARPCCGQRRRRSALPRWQLKPSSSTAVIPVPAYMTRSSPPAMPPASARRSVRRLRASYQPSIWSPPVLASRWCRHRCGGCRWMGWPIAGCRARPSQGRHCCWRLDAPTPRRWCVALSIWSGRQRAPFRIPRCRVEDERVRYRFHMIFR